MRQCPVRCGEKLCWWALHLTEMLLYLDDMKTTELFSTLACHLSKCMSTKSCEALKLIFNSSEEIPERDHNPLSSQHGQILWLINCHLCHIWQHWCQFHFLDLTFPSSTNALLCACLILFAVYGNLKQETEKWDLRFEWGHFQPQIFFSVENHSPHSQWNASRERTDKMVFGVSTPATIESASDVRAFANGERMVKSKLNPRGRESGRIIIEHP